MHIGAIDQSLAEWAKDARQLRQMDWAIIGVQDKIVRWLIESPVVRIPEAWGRFIVFGGWQCSDYVFEAIDAVVFGLKHKVFDLELQARKEPLLEWLAKAEKRWEGDQHIIDKITEAKSLLLQ